MSFQLRQGACQLDEERKARLKMQSLPHIILSQLENIGKASVFLLSDYLEMRFVMLSKRLFLDSPGAI